jgi:hypothetical protein
MIHVEKPPANEIPKGILIKQLEREAPDFLAAVLSLEIPESPTRLRIPYLETADKVQAANLQKNSLTIFLEERCHYAPGEAIKIGDFYDAFIASLDPLERLNWQTKNKVTAHMPAKFPRGRLSHSPDWHYGNISFEPPTNLEAIPYTKVEQFLRQKV